MSALQVQCCFIYEFKTTCSLQRKPWLSNNSSLSGAALWPTLTFGLLSLLRSETHQRERLGCGHIIIIFNETAEPLTRVLFPHSHRKYERMKWSKNKLARHWVCPEVYFASDVILGPASWVNTLNMNRSGPVPRAVRKAFAGYTYYRINTQGGRRPELISIHVRRWHWPGPHIWRQMLNPQLIGSIYLVSLTWLVSVSCVKLNITHSISLGWVPGNPQRQQCGALALKAFQKCWVVEWGGGGCI